MENYKQKLNNNAKHGLKRNNNKGFTLLEVLISVTILAIIVAPLLAVFTSAFQTTIFSQEMLDGAYISQDVFEDLVAQDYTVLLATTTQKQLFDSDGDGNDDCLVQVNMYPDGVYSDMTSTDAPSYLHINVIGEQIIMFGSSGTNDVANNGSQTAAMDDITLINSSTSTQVSVQIGTGTPMVFDKKYMTCPLVVIVNMQQKRVNTQDITFTLSGDTSDVFVVEYARKKNFEELICSDLLESNIYYGVNDMSTTLIHANVQVFDRLETTERIGYIEGTFEVPLA